MNEDKLLSLTEFDELMETVGNLYEKRKKVNIDWTDHNDIYFPVWSKGATPISLSMSITPEDFLQKERRGGLVGVFYSTKPIRARLPEDLNYLQRFFKG